jgi:hypothetical protein
VSLFILPGVPQISLISSLDFISVLGVKNGREKIAKAESKRINLIANIEDFFNLAIQIEGVKSGQLSFLKINLI